MTIVVDGTGDNRPKAVAQTAETLRQGELAVVPTDTVYGVAADAFNPDATAKVFAAKQRSRTHPLPILVHSPKQLPGIVGDVPPAAERLMAAYWPGALTIVLHASPDLVWDIGDNEGTVAVRMPLDDVTLDVIRQVGPVAVTSANRSGEPPATGVQEARMALGDAVAVYLDDGPRTDSRPSTIVDLTRDEPFLIRDGDLPPDEVMATARGDEVHQ
ncbi:MAG: threonylcarbamoyl-AMP synthase [Actinobacteria bacterium]|nr:threonylcarbamoyl-AMP synthase [Actinomycetota bacterium]